MPWREGSGGLGEVAAGRELKTGQHTKTGDLGLVMSVVNTRKVSREKIIPLLIPQTTDTDTPPSSHGQPHFWLYPLLAVILS